LYNYIQAIALNICVNLFVEKYRHILWKKIHSMPKTAVFAPETQETLNKKDSMKHLPSPLSRASLFPGGCPPSTR